MQNTRSIIWRYVILGSLLGMCVTLFVVIIPTKTYKQVSELKEELEKINCQLEEVSSTNNQLTVELDQLKGAIDSIQAQEKSEETSNPVELLDIPSNMFCFMDYRKITNTRSPQYEIQTHCTTDEHGIRKYGQYYTVAMGSYFTRELGDTFHVTLNNGHEFDILLGDYKDDGIQPYYGHPSINYDGERCVNVIEFIVDDRAIPREVMKTGTFSVLDRFGGLTGDGGDIKSMEYTGNITVVE